MDSFEIPREVLVVERSQDHCQRVKDIEKATNCIAVLSRSYLLTIKIGNTNSQASQGAKEEQDEILYQDGSWHKEEDCVQYQ